MRTDLNTIAKQLLASDNLLIISHRAPDGDTLGSAFALKHALSQLGKKSVCFCSDEVGSYYDIITDSECVSTLDVSFAPEIIVSVDTAAPHLMGEKAQCFADRIDIAIDHHGSHVDFAKLDYVETTGANCEIIYELIKLMGVSLTERCATALLAGIVTDTGCFRFTNTSAQTMERASQLISAGARFTDIVKRFFETTSRTRFELEKLAYENIRIYDDEAVAVLPIYRKDILRLSALPTDYDGLSAIPRRIEGVRVGITLREEPDKIKVSVRTDGTINSSLICAPFGGGGHAGAAGCELYCSIDEAEEKMRSSAKAVLSQNQ